MPESPIKPDTLYLDTYTDGIATVLVRWDLTSEDRVVDEDSKTIQTIWTYEEAQVKYACDYHVPEMGLVLDTKENILTYLYANEADLLNKAMASMVSLVGKDKVPSIKIKSKPGLEKRHENKPDVIYTGRGNK